MKIHAALTLCTDDDCILVWKDHTIYWKETWHIYGKSSLEVMDALRTILKEIKVVPRANKEVYVKPMQTVIKDLLRATKRLDEYHVGGNWWGEYKLDNTTGIIIEL